MQNLKKKVEKKIQCSKRQKGKRVKKCYDSSETNSSGLCIVAGVQWHHTNELTVVLSSKVQIEKKIRKKNKTTEEGRKVKPKIES